MTLWQQETLRHSVQQDEIESLVVNNLGLVKHVISRMEMNLPYGMDKEDLVSIGNIGLIEAAHNFDKSKKVRFQTYAYIRIRGSVLDEVRRFSFGGQAIMRKHKKISDVSRELEGALMRRPTDQEVADALGLPVEKYEKMIEETSGAYLLSLDNFIESDDHLRIVDTLTSNDNHLEEIINSEQLDLVKEGIRQLHENEQMVLSLYYEQQLSLKEISLIMNLSESRISQLHKKAILSLKASIDNRR